MAAALALTAVLGWIDHITGPDIGFALFYLLPVSVAGWWVGTRAAVVVGTAASAAWFLADLMTRESSAVGVSAWNASTRLFIFIALGLLLARVHRDQAVLETMLEREQKLARTDALTGLANSRAFLAALDTELARAQRGHHRLCLMYLDVDNFKRVNDLFGHSAGDEVLVTIADSLGHATRTTDVSARLGGDEFAVLLWNLGEADVVAIAQRILERVSTLGEQYPGSRLGMSAGVVFFEDPPKTAQLAVRHADRAMYRSKQAGKGAVHVLVYRHDSAVAEASGQRSASASTTTSEDESPCSVD